MLILSLITLIKIIKLKFEIKIKKAPGPGTYRLPSEFGYYEAAKKWEVTWNKFTLNLINRI